MEVMGLSHRETDNTGQLVTVPDILSGQSTYYNSPVALGNLFQLGGSVG